MDERYHRSLAALAASRDVKLTIRLGLTDAVDRLEEHLRRAARQDP